MHFPPNDTNSYGQAANMAQENGQTKEKSTASQVNGESTAVRPARRRLGELPVKDKTVDDQRVAILNTNSISELKESTHIAKDLTKEVSKKKSKESLVFNAKFEILSNSNHNKLNKQERENQVHNLSIKSLSENGKSKQSENLSINDTPKGSDIQNITMEKLLKKAHKGEIRHGETAEGVAVAMTRKEFIISPQIYHKYGADVDFDALIVTWNNHEDGEDHFDYSMTNKKLTLISQDEMSGLIEIHKARMDNLGKLKEEKKDNETNATHKLTVKIPHNFDVIKLTSKTKSQNVFVNEINRKKLFETERAKDKKAKEVENKEEAIEKKDEERREAIKKKTSLHEENIEEIIMEELN